VRCVLTACRNKLSVAYFLDFLVVVVSLLSNIPGVGSNLSALRVIRVLRPLRTLSILPGMRALIGGGPAQVVKSEKQYADAILDTSLTSQAYKAS
jgi:hypothetical protein